MQPIYVVTAGLLMDWYVVFISYYHHNSILIILPSFEYVLNSINVFTYIHVLIFNSIWVSYSDAKREFEKVLCRKENDQVKVRQFTGQGDAIYRSRWCHLQVKVVQFTGQGDAIYRSRWCHLQVKVVPFTGQGDAIYRSRWCNLQVFPMEGKKWHGIAAKSYKE